MTKNQELQFLEDSLEELENLIDRIDRNAQKLGLEDSLVYQEVVDEFEVLKESIMDKIEEFE
jgi:hypothetical protein